MKNIVHWCKPKKMWTSHTYKSCAKSPTILINGNWSTETKPDKKANPRGWVVADHTSVVVSPSASELAQFVKKERVYYDKKAVSFTHIEGEYLLFDEEGCFVLERRE